MVMKEGEQQPQVKPDSFEFQGRTVQTFSNIPLEGYVGMLAGMKEDRVTLNIIANAHDSRILQGSTHASPTAVFTDGNINGVKTLMSTVIDFDISDATYIAWIGTGPIPGHIGLHYLQTPYNRHEIKEILKPMLSKKVRLNYVRTISAGRTRNWHIKPQS